MLRLLKKYFIPFKRNDHRPHIFRIEATPLNASYIFLCGKILHPKNGVQDDAATDELYYLFGEIPRHLKMPRDDAVEYELYIS